MKHQKRKKVAAILGVAALLAGILWGCGPQDPGVPTDSPEPTATPEPVVSPDGREKDPVPSGDGSVGVERYVTVERIQTPAGILEVPRLDTAAIPGQDAALAEQMFRDAEERLCAMAEEYADEAKKNDDTLDDEVRGALLCETKASLNGDILSVLIRYQQIYYYSTAMTLHEAVSLNVSTGEVVPPSELLELAGYDPEEASDILRAYAEDCITSQWLRIAFWGCASKNELPDGWGDPIIGWQDALDEMLMDVWMESQPIGVPWDTLERSPAMFYEGGDRLSVCARIPSMAGAGFEETMVSLGHSPAAVHYRNPLDCYGNPFGSRLPMTADAACCAAARASEVHVTEFQPVSMDIITGDERDPAYILQTPDGERWAVGVFSGTVWEEQAGDWQAIPNGTGALRLDVMTGGKSAGALAAVYNDPDEFEIWAADPGETVDLTVYGADPEDLTWDDAEALLLYAMEDHTTVRFQAGAMVDGQFESQSTFYTLELDEGQCVCVYVQRAAPGEAPSQCIDVEHAGSVARYVLQGTADELPPAEYLGDLYDRKGANG